MRLGKLQLVDPSGTKKLVDPSGTKLEHPVQDGGWRMEVGDEAAVGAAPPASSGGQPPFYPFIFIIIYLGK
jgi:hypothetical protein